MELTYKPGQRIRITQQVPRVNQEAFVSTVEGTVVRFYQGKTGSWFAHSRDRKLWLDRLEIQKGNGEMAVINLDQYTRVEDIGEGAQATPG
jgi:hypothetical protein